MQRRSSDIWSLEVDTAVVRVAAGRGSQSRETSNGLSALVAPEKAAARIGLRPTDHTGCFGQLIVQHEEPGKEDEEAVTADGS